MPAIFNLPAAFLTKSKPNTIIGGKHSSATWQEAVSSSWQQKPAKNGGITKCAHSAAIITHQPTGSVTHIFLPIKEHKGPGPLPRPAPKQGRADMEGPFAGVWL